MGSIDYNSIAQRLRGRARFLRNRGEIKSPELMEEAANMLGKVLQQNPVTGEWEPAIPAPFYWGLLPWLWKRLTGYRDQYGRKAALFLPWQ